MPRDLPISNGNLHINFDQRYSLRDLYFPHVGMENQTAGHPCRFGVWADGAFSWVGDPEWSLELGYEEDTLVTLVKCENLRLGLRLVCRDLVDFDRSLYIKRIELTDLRGIEREVRLFQHFDAYLYGINVGDTAYYEPANDGLIFYKGRRYLWLSCFADGVYGPSSYATGDKEKNAAEGTWRDAEDGKLSGNPIAQGSVDGVAGMHVYLPAWGEKTVYFWIAAGADYWEVRDLNKLVRERGLESFVTRTHNYWHLWVNKEPMTWGNLPQPIVDLYKRSLLTIRTQIDNRGAILAANDADILRFGRDTYSYVWPRDGALVSLALMDGGYGELTRRFFEFCAQVLHRDGYLLHKFNPDGSLGSSWHPWVGPDGEFQIPLQEDQTALVIMSLWHHFDRFRDVEFIRPLYRRLVKTAADFLTSYRDPTTRLPGLSHDLWEERRGILSYTTAAVWAGLTAASRFTECFGEHALSASYRRAAEEIRENALRYLFDYERDHFSRMINVAADGSLVRDNTLDASLCGLFQFGMLEPSHPAVVSTVRAIERRLWCKTEVGGVARYEDDHYQQVSTDVEKVPGNPWFICTLWLADWYAHQARSMAELQLPLELLEWVRSRALPSGILAEQVHPFTGEPLSVSPLTWSHATFVLSVQNYLRKYRELLTQRPRRQRGALSS